MKETVLSKHQIDVNYLSSLPVDVLSITFIWTNDEKLNFYRTFTSTLSADDDGTEERHWTLPDSTIISEEEIVSFVQTELEHAVAPAFMILYDSGVSSVIDIRGD